MNRKPLLLVILAVIAVVSACTPSAGGGGGSGTLPVTYNVGAAAPYLLQPNKAPAGSNDNNCKPTAAHPRPVVLVHGTIATMGENFATISPLLKNNGYCVFAFNYGGTWLSSITLGNIQGLDSPYGFANTLAGFVDHVLAATGAQKVDIVGHSQGGMLPNYYVKFLGGAPKVNSIVGLAPVNHGTTLSGLLTLGQDLT
ncbi:MAG: alpha/beta fold hydrolase [Microthrixaceae bacterium]